MRMVWCSAAHFWQLVNQVLDRVPERFRPYLENVAIEVADFPTREELAELGEIESSEVFGLFIGVPLGEQDYSFPHPNIIKIFRKPLLAFCRDKSQLEREIEKTILHELAHHFGFSEDDLEEFEAGP